MTQTLPAWVSSAVSDKRAGPRVVGGLPPKVHAKAPSTEPFSGGSDSPSPSGPLRAGLSCEERQAQLAQQRDSGCGVGLAKSLGTLLAHWVCGSLAPPLRLSWWLAETLPVAISTHCLCPVPRVCVPGTGKRVCPLPPLGRAARPQSKLSDPPPLGPCSPCGSSISAAHRMPRKEGLADGPVPPWKTWLWT